MLVLSPSLSSPTLLLLWRRRGFQWVFTEGFHHFNIVIVLPLWLCFVAGVHDNNLYYSPHWNFQIQIRTCLILGWIYLLIKYLVWSCIQTELNSFVNFWWTSFVKSVIFVPPLYYGIYYLTSLASSSWLHFYENTITSPCCLTAPTLPVLSPLSQ